MSPVGLSARVAEAFYARVEIAPVRRPAAFTLAQSSDAIGDRSIGFGQAIRAQGRDRK